MKISIKLAVAALALGLAACSSEKDNEKSNEATTPESALGAASEEVAAEAAATAAASLLQDNLNFLEENKSKDGVQTTESGLQYRIIEEGTGTVPNKDDFVVVHYAGRLIDGTEFDSSYKRGEPATFPAGRLIKGWTEALTMMPVGSKWELVIPAGIAYGERGAGGVIPPNATLVFDVELLDVKSEEQARAEEEAQMKAFLEQVKADSATFLAENAKKDGVTVTESGLQYRVVTEGTGNSPTGTSQVTVHYAGTLVDGTEFDSSYARGEPISFALDGVIKGWTEGVQLMKEGAKYEFFIPYDLAYGENGSRSIPPYAALIFTVELISVDS